MIYWSKNLVFHLLFYGHHCKFFHNQGFSSIYFPNTSMVHTRGNWASNLVWILIHKKCVINVFGKEFWHLFCFCLAFLSFESWEEVECLSLVRIKLQVPFWDEVESLSLVRIELQVPLTNLSSSCVPNPSKIEIWGVGWPNAIKTNGFFDSFKDCSSSSSFTKITETLAFRMWMWMGVGGAFNSSLRTCYAKTLRIWRLLFFFSRGCKDELTQTTQLLMVITSFSYEFICVGVKTLFGSLGGQSPMFPWDGLVNPFNGWLEGLGFVILTTRRVSPWKSFNTNSSSSENEDWPYFLLVTGT